jgi:hypothetical protein
MLVDWGTTYGRGIEIVSRRRLEIFGLISRFQIYVFHLEGSVGSSKLTFYFISG